MKKYFVYLVIYSIGGFILERFINLIFIGNMYDNSVLWGPYQPLYGFGILMALITYDLVLHRIPNKIVRYSVLLVVSILTTGISEAVTGYGYEYLYNAELWDYSDYFVCQLQYVCWLPTSLFGIGSFLVIVVIHPYLSLFIKTVPKKIFNIVFYVLLFILLFDLVITFTIRLR